MRKYIIIGLLTIFAACSSVPLDTRVSQTEAAYAGVLSLLIEARKPCVDEDTSNDNLCFIDDATYIKVDLFVDATDVALNQAKLLLEVGDKAGAEDYLKIILSNLAELTEIAQRIREEM